MAGKSTISITFKLEGDGKGFKDMAKDAEGLKNVIASAVTEAEQLKGNVINFAALATGLDAAQRSFSQLQSTMSDLAGAYAVQEANEAKLAQNMRNTMGATDAEIQSIKDLCSEQQKLGVIGDEVQLAGAQELATYLELGDSLKTLIPVLNDMNAQQYGLEATTESSVTIATMLGKVMNGQVGALSRYGYSFDEVQEKVLKFGTESERAAVLAEVVSQSVGGMNQALAQTESGKQQQLANALGDVKEKLGGIVNGALPFVTIASQSLTAATSVATLASGFKSLIPTLAATTKAFAVSTAAVIKNKVATIATAVAQKTVAAATKAWAAVQKILNIVLTANPIGLVIQAVGLLVGGFVLAYKKSDSFREMCTKLWDVIGPLAKAIMDGLVKALTWVIDKCKIAVDWIKKLLGLGGKKAEVEVEVKTTQTSNPEVDAIYDKYANYTPPKETSGGSTSAKPAAASESNGLIGQLEAKIADARKRLTEATSEAAIEAINKELEAYEGQLDKYQSLGKKVGEAVADGVEDNGPIWKADADNLRDISGNIDILNQKLQTASISEAAAINKEIQLWNDKADAIKNAGKEAEKVSISTGAALRDGWGNLKMIGNSIESITEALQGNGNAWQIVVGLIDGFIGLYDGVKAIIGIIELLTAASTAHAAVKGVEAGAETTEAAVRGTTAATNASASAAIIVANKLEAASWKELAASEYMAAHAYIPFAGFGIAMGFVTAMLAATAVAGIPALAEGGIASGPTLALVGEYAGASGNPEIIAPLDKLRGMLDTGSGNIIGGQVEFKIKGRELVGILTKENNLIKRT